MPDKIEWYRPTDQIDTDLEWRFAQIEAQRKIAEELHRLNDNIEKIMESGVSDEDKDK